MCWFVYYNGIFTNLSVKVPQPFPVIQTKVVEKIVPKKVNVPFGVPVQGMYIILWKIYLMIINLISKCDKYIDIFNEFYIINLEQVLTNKKHKLIHMPLHLWYYNYKVRKIWNLRLDKNNIEISLFYNNFIREHILLFTNLMHNLFLFVWKKFQMNNICLIVIVSVPVPDPGENLLPKDIIIFFFSIFSQFLFFISIIYKICKFHPDLFYSFYYFFSTVGLT